MNYYRIVYPEFDEKRFDSLLKSFGLQKNRKINTFSKGMKKQVSILCGICAGTEYLFCDETFDGLDRLCARRSRAFLRMTWKNGS